MQMPVMMTPMTRRQASSTSRVPMMLTIRSAGSQSPWRSKISVRLTQM
jgi:hypothetical protein